MIIAVSGFRSSGKSLFGTVAKRMGFPVFEMSAPVLDLMKELGMPTTNESVRNFASDLREKGGPDAVAKLLLPKLREYLLEKRTVVVIGARSLEEISVFRNAAYTASVAIISQEQKRFERTQKRKKKSDPSDLESFRWADRVEEKWGLKKLVEKADFKLDNSGPEPEFREKVKTFLSRYK